MNIQEFYDIFQCRRDYFCNYNPENLQEVLEELKKMQQLWKMVGVILESSQDCLYLTDCVTH